MQSSVASDKAGFDSMMISEHASQIWENIPNPELIIAAAALQTRNIKFAPMAHILPHHNPTKLAMMVGWLSQILEGRYFMGIGAGAYPLASYMHGIRGDDQKTEHLNAMVRESLEIMEKIWKREPFFYEGKYWDAGFPEEEVALTEEDEQHKLANYAPWGGSFPEFAVTGFSANSPSMRLAGEKNFKPVSIFSGEEALKRHWDIYAEANIKAGFTPDRQRHAVSQTVFVGDTDAEAKKEVMEGPIGYCFNKYLIPIWRRFGMMDGFAKDAESIRSQPISNSSSIMFSWSDRRIPSSTRSTPCSQRSAAGARCRSRAMIITTIRHRGSTRWNWPPERWRRASPFPGGVSATRPAEAAMS